MRQRPATEVDPDGDPATVFELGWITTLGEDRTLTPRCGDPAEAQRLARVLEQTLREVDDERRQHRRKVDWILVVLLVLGAAAGIRNLNEAWPLTSAYDWTAALTNLAANVLALPLLYLAVRAGIRWIRSRRTTRKRFGP